MENQTLLSEDAEYSGGDVYAPRRRQGPRRYWRLRGGGKRLTKAIRAGGGSRRYWRMKAIPRLSLVVKTPLKVLRKLKNAYIEFMLRLAGKVGALNDDNIFGSKRIPKARKVKNKGRFSPDDFERRLIYEISKDRASRKIVIYDPPHEHNNSIRELQPPS
ncbi:uncharacterized protein G2W53_032273 [Senna tora]|uniref:Uncharacterized protein n=1 Tax=Senna tora TaxID=362788 RepID=A0A834W6N1_9FABA|nr:uncharacterized protein G2W53_032273 [Senna tora]